MTVKKISCISALLAAALCPLAHADDNNIIDLGISDLTVHAASPGVTGPYVPTGLNISVDNATTMFLSYTRVLTKDFDFQLAVGVPPTQDVRAAGPAYVGSVPYNGQTVITAKQITPTGFFNYKFLEPESRLQPYLGIGVNWTHFSDIKSTAANNAINGGPTNVAISNSNGPAAQIGLRYRFMDHISVNFAVQTADVSTTETSNTAGIIRKTSIDFHPVVYTLTGAYSF